MTENISKLRIEGGTPLVGEVHVRGAKNLVPKAIGRSTARFDPLDPA